MLVRSGGEESRYGGTDGSGGSDERGGGGTRFSDKLLLPRTKHRLLKPSDSRRVA